jgi:hypothetical protein
MNLRHRKCHARIVALLNERDTHHAHITELERQIRDLRHLRDLDRTRHAGSGAGHQSQETT